MTIPFLHVSNPKRTVERGLCIGAQGLHQRLRLHSPSNHGNQVAWSQREAFWELVPPTPHPRDRGVPWGWGAQDLGWWGVSPDLVILMISLGRAPGS